MWLSHKKTSSLWSVVHLRALWISVVSHTKLGFIKVWLTFVLPAVEVFYYRRKEEKSMQGKTIAGEG